MPLPGRTVEENPPRSLNSQLAVGMGKLQRQLHQLPHQPNLAVQAADVFKGHLEGALRRVGVGEVQMDFCIGADHARRFIQFVHHVGGAPAGVRKCQIDYGAFRQRNL